jgi:hypothetical protein
MTYQIRINVTRTYEASFEIEATSATDARAQAEAINPDALLLHPTNADQVDVVAAYVSSIQKVA